VVMIPAQIARVVVPCIVAVSIMLMLVRPRRIPEAWWISGGTLLLIALLAREISGATLLLVAGLFVMVDAVESQGALNLTQRWLAWASSLGQSVGAMVIGFAVGIANNLVNNLPLGLIAGGTIQASHTKGLMANAVLIAVDLGPNLCVTGSLATILWLLAPS